MVTPANEDEAKFFEHCEKLGEAEIRAQCATGALGARLTLALKWINLKDEERAIRRDEQAARSIEAAERAATASEQSALATKDAARWAMYAAIASLLGVIVSVIKDFWIAK